MKKNIFFLFMCAIFMTADLHAAGLGACLDYSGSLKSVLDRDYEDTLLDAVQEAGAPIGERSGLDFLTIGGGFVVDTAFDNHSLFNYRFILCLYYIEAVTDSNRLGSTLYRGYGTSQQHAVGVALIRSDMLRFWIGPQIAYSYNTIFTADDVDSNMLIMLFLSIGPVIGCDISVTGTLSVLVSCGYRYTMIHGSDDFRGLFEDKSFQGYAHNGFLQAAILYRFGHGEETDVNP